MQIDPASCSSPSPAPARCVLRLARIPGVVGGPGRAPRSQTGPSQIPPSSSPLGTDPNRVVLTLTAPPRMRGQGFRDRAGRRLGLEVGPEPGKSGKKEGLPALEAHGSRLTLPTFGA